MSDSVWIRKDRSNENLLLLVKRGFTVLIKKPNNKYFGAVVYDNYNKKRKMLVKEIVSDIEKGYTIIPKNIFIEYKYIKKYNVSGDPYILNNFYNDVREYYDKQAS